MFRTKTLTPSPQSLTPTLVPADLDTLCLKCLEKDPSRRFPTAAALAQELHRELAAGHPIGTRPATVFREPTDRRLL